jgi:hypothetical protein
MLDAVATVILAGMMFIPIINLVVGIIVGTGLFGVREVSQAQRLPS